jgi:hypothetical protein
MLKRGMREEIGTSKTKVIEDRIIENGVVKIKIIKNRVIFAIRLQTFHAGG